MTDEPEYEYDVKIHENFVLGVVMGTLCGIATGGLSLVGALSALGGAAIGSAAVINANGEKVVRINKYYTPAYYKNLTEQQELEKNKLSPEKLGYIKARRWTEPLTDVQLAELNSKFDES